MRDTRVLTRRALVLTEDHEKVSDKQIELISRLSIVTAGLSDLYYGSKDVTESTEIPKLIAELRDIAGQCSKDVASDSLSAQAILAQVRSLCVDLLQICGLSRRSAVTSLIPIADDPARYEELWNDI